MARPQGIKGICKQFLAVTKADKKNRKTVSRDHHIEAFTVWMAGAALNSGYIHGQSDDIGFGHEQLTSRLSPPGKILPLW